MPRVVSSQHPGLALTTREVHPEVCLAWTSAHGTLGEAGKIPEHCGVARRRRRWVLCVVRRATAWNCDQKRTVNALAEAVAASRLFGYPQTCVVAGSGCKVGLNCCSLHSLRALGWKVEAVEEAEAAAVRPVVWPTRESSFLYQLSHIVVERLRDVLELRVSRASVVEGQLEILVGNQDTGHEALRAAIVVGRCCPLARSTVHGLRTAPLVDLMCVTYRYIG